GGDVNGVYKSEDRGKHWRICNTGIANYAIYSLAVDAKNPDTVYAGTPGGVCRSADAGEHWEFLEQTGPKALAITAERNKSVRGLAVDPATGTVYAGTPKGKVLKSEDGGRSWKMLYELKAKGGVVSVAVSPKNSRLLLAATTSAGLLRSEDGGESWTELQTPKNVSHAAFAPSDDQIIYAACGKEGVLKSTDKGQTWNPARTGIDPKCAIIEVVVDPKTADTVYAIGNGGWNGTFFRSADGGTTWTPVRDIATDVKGNPTLPDEWPGKGKGSFSTLTNIALNPNNPKELFVAANWRNCFSADAGVTWEERDAGADITCVSDIRFCDGKTYVTAMDEGLLASDDHGASWRQLCPLKYSEKASGHQWRIAVSKKPDGATRIVTTCSPWSE
ncbi:MAG: sialidase family protein, partial [Planctomycetota bacterium]|nr:sialidase family protein [Planctomycetota bacterium]